MSDVFRTKQSVNENFPKMHPSDLKIDAQGGNTGKAGNSVRMRERVKSPELSDSEIEKYYRLYTGEQLYKHPETVPYLTGQELFGSDETIAWDFGCGRGERVIELAEKNPERKYVGVDIHILSLMLGTKAAAMSGINNVKFIRADAHLLVKRIPDESVSEAGVLFPAPQPNNNGGFNDVLSDTFAANIHRILEAEGSPFEFATDSEPYFNTRMRALAELALFSCSDEELRHGLSTTDAKTRYQRLWESKNIHTHSATLRKI